MSSFRIICNDDKCKRTTTLNSSNNNRSDKSESICISFFIDLRSKEIRVTNNTTQHSKRNEIETSVSKRSVDTVSIYSQLMNSVSTITKSRDSMLSLSNESDNTIVSASASVTKNSTAIVGVGDKFNRINKSQTYLTALTNDNNNNDYYSFDRSDYRYGSIDSSTSILSKLKNESKLDFLNENQIKKDGFIISISINEDKHLIRTFLCNDDEDKEEENEEEDEEDEEEEEEVEDGMINIFEFFKNFKQQLLFLF
jgi:hypothetical protein